MSVGNGSPVAYFIVASTLKVSIVYALMAGGLYRAVMRCGDIWFLRLHWLRKSIFTGIVSRLNTEESYVRTVAGRFAEGY